MKIAILGTGSVGATIGSRLVDLGHQVMMGSRTANNEKALAFVSKHQGLNAAAGTFSEAATYGEVIFNCTKGEYSLDAIALAGKGVNGKVLIDVSNPLDFSNGMPPASNSKSCKYKFFR
jgi:predicted dinucleotide-binding enzyme